MNRPAKPRTQKAGLDLFKASIAKLRRNGFTDEACRFEDSLKHRRRLMKALRKLDPKHPVLAEMDKMDGRLPQVQDPQA
jgi:hypothetical protein